MSTAPRHSDIEHRPCLYIDRPATRTSSSKNEPFPTKFKQWKIIRGPASVEKNQQYSTKPDKVFFFQPCRTGILSFVRINIMSEVLNFYSNPTVPLFNGLGSVTWAVNNEDPMNISSDSATNRLLTMIFLFSSMWLWIYSALLLLIHPSPSSGVLGPGDDGSGWKCPGISQPMVECSCDMPHTLRCTGTGSKAMQLIGKKLRNLPLPAAVSLLDCTVQNVSEIPGPILEGVALHGLVVSSGKNFKKQRPMTNLCENHQQTREM